MLKHCWSNMLANITIRARALLATQASSRPAQASRRAHSARVALGCVVLAVDGVAPLHRNGHLALGARLPAQLQQLTLGQQDSGWFQPTNLRVGTLWLILYTLLVTKQTVKKIHNELLLPFLQLCPQLVLQCLQPGGYALPAGLHPSQQRLGLQELVQITKLLIHFPAYLREEGSCQFAMLQHAHPPLALPRLDPQAELQVGAGGVLVRGDRAHTLHGDINRFLLRNVPTLHGAN